MSNFLSAILWYDDLYFEILELSATLLSDLHQVLLPTKRKDLSRRALASVFEAKALALRGHWPIRTQSSTGARFGHLPCGQLE